MERNPLNQGGPGGRANDATRTIPDSPVGRSAATRMASGPEKDSATMTKRSAVGNEDRTTGSNAEYEEKFEGYETTVVFSD